MIRIDFGNHGGGIRGFKDAAAVVTYLEACGQDWLKSNPQNPNGNYFATMSRPWAKVRQVVENQRAQTGDDPDSLAAVIRQSSYLRQLATTSSEAGQAIISIDTDLGSQAATGAIKFFLAGPGDLVFQDIRRDAIEGVLALRDRIAGNSTAKTQAARAAITKLKTQLSTDVMTHRHELNEFEGRHAKSIEAIEQSSEQQKQDWEEWLKETHLRIAADHEKWKADWLELYQAYTEKLALESPVKLWNDRADEHDTRAKSLVWWVVGMGAVGAAAAAVIAASALNFGHWLLSGGEDAGGNPTNAELLFALSTTLLYLTLFFWTMRIAVRMYMTEQHLGIDARSRASMAQTYLALTKENAATEQDRAIVLGSMFRPVVDGIVKDDGLPAITPAAILAGLAGGKLQR